MRKGVHAYALGMVAAAVGAVVALATEGPPVGTTRPATTTAAATVPAVRQDPVPPPPAPGTPPSVVVTKPPATGPTSVPSVVVAPAPTPAAAQPPIDPRALYGWAYGAGLRVHDHMAEDGRPAGDQTLIMQAFLDGLAAKNPTYTKDELRAAAAEARSYLQVQRATRAYADDPKFRREADENAAQGRALLDRAAKEAGVQVRPDAVQVQVIEPAKDPSARVWGNAKAVTLDLRVSLADGTLVSATEAGHPAKVDVADLLPAVVDACRGMRVGDRVRVMVPGEKAYGLAGKPPVIGPNQAMEYDLRLVGVE